MSKGNLKGKLIALGETKQVSDKFKKRDIVIETSGEYPQTILLELHQDKVSIGDTLNIGDNINCSYDLRGRKWTNPEGIDKYFNTITCWKIESDNPTKEESTESVTDDLPF